MWGKWLSIWFVFHLASTFAQFGNEWIDYSQRYYTFKVAEDGVYKLSYAQLQSAGIPVETINPEQFQIFGFQKEQPVWVEDGGDGSFDPDDFIVLYAKKNTTWIDSLMYESPDLVANKYYPHYNDTIHYYLTWSTGDHKRFEAETDVDFAAYSPQPYFLKTTYKERHNLYLDGYKVSGISYSYYTEGEGWFGGRISALAATNYQDENLVTTNAYTGVGAPSVKGLAVSVGASNAIVEAGVNHHLKLQYGPSNTTLVDTIFYGYQKNNLSFEIPPAALGSSTTRVRHQLVNDLGAPADYQSVAFVELVYPHTPNLEGASIYELTVPHNPLASKSYYNFTSYSGTSPWVFTLNGSPKRIPVVMDGGNLKMIIPNTAAASEQQMVIWEESEMLVPESIKAINETGFFTNYNSTSFENAYLMISHPLLWSGATDYKNYRESIAGGGYNVILANAQELNHQFGGGVPAHVWGIRQFALYAYNNSGADKPKYLFLIGKGIREANESVATGFGIRQSSLAYGNSYVPTFGYPASDNMITHKLSGNEWDPLIPTGRVAAKTNAEVLIYLNKVQDYELAQDPNSIYTVNDKLWQKEILHFGGGSTEAEQSTFRYYLNNYEYDLENPKFGGNVTSYYKTVSDPVDPALLTEVTGQINNGVSLMTFFGHASADGFDQNIDDPSNWNNQGKYPIVVGNACLTGNIFEPTALSASEEYILIEDKGAIGFMANVKQAFSNSLDSYSKVLFNKMADEDYGLSISEQSQHTIQQVQTGGLSFGLLNVCNQMTLHGDPAIKLNYHEKPELEINHTSLFFEPDEVDLTVDSIDVHVVVYNLGKSAVDTFAIELTRTFPNGGGDSLYTQLLSGIDYIDTVVFTIPFYNNIGVGINTFKAAVDIPSIVDEQYDEIGNNTYTKQVLFNVDGIYPVYPYNYAVVPNDTITLKASTVNPFADFANYRFEIDTTDLFDSPEKRYHLTTSAGGVVEVNYNEWLNANTGMSTDLVLEDSMVYFWRVSVDDGSGEYYWIEESFQYIPEKSGWGQDHFFQFKNNHYLFLDYEREIRKRLFGPSFKTIDCDVYGNATGWFEFAYTLFHIDGSLDPGFGEYNFCSTNPQFLVAVIDPFTLKSWGTRWDNGGAIPMQNPDHDFGNANDNGGCRNRVEDHFGFYQNNPEQLMAFENMMLNEIPDSFYYLIYTSRYANYSEWEVYPEVYDVFTELGCDSIYPGRDEVPFIVFGKMGNPSATKEVYGQFLDELIHFEDTLWGYDFLGEESSTQIGPAQHWETLYWKQNPMEPLTDDSTRLKVYGITADGGENLIIDTAFTFNDSILNLNSIIDADNYPYLRLNAQHWDSTGFTPAQIDRWHVLYTPAPEAALDGTDGVYWMPSDSLVEGQEIAVSFNIRNIADLPMDSLLINYWIEDNDHNLLPINYPRQDSLRVGETIQDTLFIPTLHLAGYNSLWVEVNPYNTYGVKDQIEQYHFNNIGQIPFTVIGDNENPILDVTFNGYHILNGDLIDPRSEVIITLKDENEYLIMDSEADTVNFGIYLTKPNGVQEQLHFRNGLGEPLMEWIPADASNKKFKIIYRGDFEENGIYRLLVQGVDKSGNVSGDFDYDIEFEVDHHSSITNLMNYPNPFSTSTQFVFTLTGATVPDEFTIQIMTVTGKVVREITRAELGDIHIGRNITDYTWNGTDEFGDQLANGVYLYRVIVKINGESVDHRESGADQYFTKSFGKMYLMR